MVGCDGDTASSRYRGIHGDGSGTLVDEQARGVENAAGPEMEAAASGGGARLHLGCFGSVDFVEGEVGRREGKAPSGGGKRAIDSEVGGGERDRASRRRRQDDPGGDVDVPVWVRDGEMAESVFSEQVGGEDEASQTIRRQGKGIAC